MELKPEKSHHTFASSTSPTTTTTTTTTTTQSKQPPNQATEALKDITFGSIAGIAGKIVEYPFDTVKVRLQSQPDHLPLRYTGPLDCFRQSIRQDGVRGLYRGVSAPFAGAAAETACLFFSYRVAKEWLERTMGVKKLGLGGLVMAACFSGAVTSLVLTPIELVKCRMQVPLYSAVDPTLSPHSTGLSTKPLSPFTVIRDVYRREGVTGFWRGQLGTFLRETGGTAAWFGAYEASTLYFRTKQHSALSLPEQADVDVSGIKLPIHQQLFSGALAGMSYNFLFYPADTIKSKMQTGELSTTTGGQQTFSSVGRALWRTHGLKGLYRGCGITVARSAPSSALIFAIVEQLKTAFG